MPTYEYECEDCNHAFEEFQYMSDPVLTDCPQCGKKTLRRLIGAGAGIIFKGSGFYETDYKRKEQPKPASEKAASAPKSEPAKSDSTPAPAPAKADAPAASSAKAS